jgi:ABC-type branched-subunit amino acid transport system substrate-binding protein
MRQHRLTLTLVPLSLAALLLSACASTDSGSGGGSGGGSTAGDTNGLTDSSIALASSQTLSGPGAASCKGITDAAAKWFDHVNSTGGVQKRQIKYTVLDDGYDPSRAIANVRTLQPKNFAMVGACGSTTAAAIYKPLSAQGMPFLFPINGVGTLVKPATPGMFQVQPLYEDEVATLIAYGYGQSGKGSVYTVVNPLGSYQAVIDRSKTVAESNGGSFVGSSETALGTADYTPIALKIKQAKPDYVLMSMGGSDYAKLINALVAQDAMPAKLAMGVSANGAFANSYDQSAASKIRFASLEKLPLAPDSDCGKVLADSPSLAGDPSAIGGCAIAQLITTAIEETSPLTRSNVDKTIQGWTNKDAVPNVIAPVTFTATQHLGTTELYIVQPVAKAFKTLATCPYGSDASLGKCEAAS